MNAAWRIAAIAAMILALAGCARPLTAGDAPAPQHDAPDRGGGDHGGGGM